MGINTTTDLEPRETQEWLEALDAVVEINGKDRANFILQKLIQKSKEIGCDLDVNALKTQYINTIQKNNERDFLTNEELEQKIRNIIKWNAMAIVVRGGKKDLDLGGHISSFASSELMYDICFNHFFKAPTKENGGDLIYYQGHISPGIYSRSFVEGRLTEEDLDSFRQEAKNKGLSSYPHPKLMPDYWQFPTVSMGLGPMQAIYQARYLNYLTNRKLKDCSSQNVYCFMGDGECDEPESLGALTVASREKLDNLIFVINCNLQRLDGPVRGNGKVIEELEGIFLGANWNVIKVIWGSEWDELITKDTSGKLLQLMQETVDGEYQNLASKDGAYIREHFFGKYPETAELVKHMTDDEVFKLRRGGHDPIKVYNAFAKAQERNGQPTVILAKTIKGYGMGKAAEAKNIAHQVKKLNLDSVKEYRDKLNIPISDADIEKVPYYKPSEDSEEIKYIKQKRQELNGYLPQRRVNFSQKLNIPEVDIFSSITKGTDGREVSTTMSFVRILSTLVRNKDIGKYIIPIVPDEARTFGMEGMFRQVGIYSHVGQKYTPQDRDQMSFYKESVDGQVLQEGINELGAMASWLNAATSYSTNDVPTIPFYIYYSMFGFQRVGDMAWAAGDMQARGFLLGATAGRTTLNGEGLQHQDGHSHIQAQTIPNCVSYDPTYAYEIAVIVQDGIKRMYGEKQENIFYYITLMNENYEHPPIPADQNKGIIKGIYKLESTQTETAKPQAQLLGSGTILKQVREAAKMLMDDFNIAVDVYSVTSFNELARDGQECDRNNILNTESNKKPYISEVLNSNLITIAATDYMKMYAEQVRPYIKNSYTVLGTDGFGRSDSRENLRDHFEVSAKYIVLATLTKLVELGEIKKELVSQAIVKYNIKNNKPNPATA